MCIGNTGTLAGDRAPYQGAKIKSAGSADHTDAANRRERAKDFLVRAEMGRSLDTPKAGRHGTRDLLMLVMYRHDLRVSEAIGLWRNEVDLDRARLWVRRLKSGLSVEQPIAGDGLRAIKRGPGAKADALSWLFVSERRQLLTRQAVNHLVVAAAARASLPGVHPHTFCHSCGFILPDKGHDLRLIQDYLGHCDPRHTVHYPERLGGALKSFGVKPLLSANCGVPLSFL